MQVCGQHFTMPILERIQETALGDPSISRRELSRQVCQWLDWRFPDGRFKDMSCRKALAELNRKGVLDLPPAQNSFAYKTVVKNRLNPQIPELNCSLAQLGEVSVQPITSRHSEASKIWFALMDEHHYLGGGPLCGAQIRYIVKSSRYGYLGALSFSSASWAIKARDDYIQWTEPARIANLGCLVNNSRFLILPSVKVNNLASHTLALSLSRLTQDWQQRYHVRPVLVETFVDPSRFYGTCYQAANWKYVGDTSGRRDGSPKKIFVYPLCRNWRQVLCEPPQISLGDMPRSDAPAHWAEEEFSTVRFYDNRLKQRLYTIAQDFYGNPEANIPEACGSKAATMGAYRFFNNEKVSMDVLLTAHTEATIERIRQHKVVLAPQDTSILNYTAHPDTQGLGPINHSHDTMVGLILHDTLAFSEDGTPLGVLDAQCWARDPEDIGKKHRRGKEPIERKESVKWLRSFQKVGEVQKLCPDTMLVSIGDRESDIYELFLEASQDAEGPKLLVRAEKTRQRKTEQGQLWDVMAQQKVAGSIQVHIPHSGSRKARDTWIDIRFSQVKLKAPRRLSSSPDIDIWAVYAVEPEQQEAKSPIEWMLLTTVAVQNFEDAKQRVEWYSGRWGIEVYHRTLKSGCRIKDRQLHSANRIEACLGIDMVVAWRIYHLTMLGRETPDVPCTVFFKDIEWKALCCYANKTADPPPQPPSLQEAIFMLAGIGGFMGRKSDGNPGTQTIWRGLLRLDTATEMYALMTHKKYQSPLKSGP